MKTSKRNKNARLSFIKKRGSKPRIKRTKKINHKQNGGSRSWHDQVSPDDLIKLMPTKLKVRSAKPQYDEYLTARCKPNYYNHEGSRGMFIAENGMKFKLANNKSFWDVDIYNADGKKMQRLQESVYPTGMMCTEADIYMKKYDLHRLPDTDDASPMGDGRYMGEITSDASESSQ